ncbi:MAG: methylated-DNA--[protein]-cysteine S-methyltransferase [Symbiobacteriaceae bacterium]|nr:methylated-DNA--[protein]-cysteine S-methyltransferase [Symbiobacteriaceae bacterium]
MAHTGLFQEVYAIVRTIPRGKVLSYGQIATMLGNPRWARRVGQAMYGAPAALHLPCHRVVMKDGSLCHEPFGSEQRARLLAEGITFLPGGRVDMPKHRWHGECG